MKSILLLFAICVLPSIASAQLHRYVVLYNSHTSVGMPDNIHATGFMSDGSLIWNPEQPPQLVSQIYNTQTPPVCISDGQGGFILAVTKESRDSAQNINRDIYLLRADSSGKILWGDSTAPVSVARSSYIEQDPSLVLTKTGTVLVFYEIVYTSPTGSYTDRDIAVHSFDINTGTTTWKNAAWVAHSKRHEHLVSITPSTDNDNGTIAIYTATSDSNDIVSNGDIYGQHINADGEVGWMQGNTTPVQIATSKHIERNPAVVSDRLGGAFIAYEIQYVEGPRKGDVDILAQHITATGKREWTNSQKPPIVSSDPNAKETNPSIALIEGNHIVVAFEVKAYLNRKPVTVIGIQRCDSSGTAVWNKGNKATLVATPKHVPSKPKIASDKWNNVFVVTEAMDTANNNNDIYVQSIENKTGVLKWGETTDRFMGVLATSDDEREADLLPDDNNNLYIVATRYSRSAESVGTSNIIIQRIAPDGSFPWASVGNAPLLLTRSHSVDSTARMLRVW